jgi:lipopolysaccharide transport system permease protein
MAWTFFQQSVLSAAESLIEQGSIVRRARFPRETIPAAVVTVQLITFAAILVVLTPLSLALRGTAAPASLLLLPVLMVLMFCFVLGCSLIVSVLHAFFRDAAPILAAALLPWFFLTPIFYQPDKTIPFVEHHPAVATLLNWVNPVAPFIDSFRSILYYGTAPSLGRLVYVSVAAVVALIGGSLVFRRMEGDLAVVV